MTCEISALAIHFKEEKALFPFPPPMVKKTGEEKKGLGHSIQTGREEGEKTRSVLIEIYTVSSKLYTRNEDEGEKKAS